MSQLRTTATTKVTVGVADMKVARGPGTEIITYALGSCIGVTVWDPKSKVGGMLHYLLPTSKDNEAKAEKQPYMFADTGIPKLFEEVKKAGGTGRLIVCAAGGAEVMGGDGHFKIGSRNRTILRKLLFKQSMLLKAENTGGNSSRTVFMSLDDGTVRIKSQGKVETLWAP